MDFLFYMFILFLGGPYRERSRRVSMNARMAKNFGQFMNQNVPKPMFFRLDPMGTLNFHLSQNDILFLMYKTHISGPPRAQMERPCTAHPGPTWSAQRPCRAHPGPRWSAHAGPIQGPGETPPDPDPDPDPDPGELSDPNQGTSRRAQ